MKYTIQWTAPAYYYQIIEADSESDAKEKAFNQTVDFDYISGVKTIESIKEEL
jgi:hypothetical protein